MSEIIRDKLRELFDQLAKNTKIKRPVLDSRCRACKKYRACPHNHDYQICQRIKNENSYY